MEAKGFHALFDVEGTALYKQQHANGVVNGVNGTIAKPHEFVIIEPVASGTVRLFSAALHGALIKEGESLNKSIVVTTVAWADLAANSFGANEDMTFISLVELETSLLDNLSETN